VVTESESFDLPHQLSPAILSNHHELAQLDRHAFSTGNPLNLFRRRSIHQAGGPDLPQDCMNCQLIPNRHELRSLKAFTILEVVVAMTLLLMLVVAVYGGISSGMTTVRMARENLRAKQILLEKMEALRLYNWDQLNGGFLSPNFIVNYDVNNSSTNSGVLYRGTVSIKAAPLGTTYDDQMRLVTVRLDWKTGLVPRHRELSTYVCRSGLQNYIY
jgi:type II secretory pathway pseudopilin PulG